MTIICQSKDQSNGDYKKVLETFIDVVETYGGTFNKPVLVLLQLATNGFVAGANVDVLGVANTAHIAAAKATVA